MPPNDFLARQTRAQPIAALAELIWNSLDSEASRVDIERLCPSPLADISDRSLDWPQALGCPGFEQFRAFYLSAATVQS